MRKCLSSRCCVKPNLDFVYLGSRDDVFLTLGIVVIGCSALDLIFYQISKRL